MDDGLSTEQFNATLGLIVTFRLLASVPVLARLGCSKHRRLKLWLDDYLIALASVIYWAQAIVEVVRTTNGRTPRSHDPTQISRQQKTYYQSSYVNDIFYALVLTLTRWSITTQVIYYFVLPQTSLTGDITSGERPAGRLSCFSALAFNGFWGIFAILISVLQCVPLHLLWDNDERDAGCLSVSAIVLSVSVWDLACSVMTFIVTVAPVLKSGAWKSKIIGSLLTLILGLLTLSIEIARIGTSTTINRPAFIRTSAAYNALAPIECCFAILCACVPLITPSSHSTSLAPRPTRKERLRAIRDRIFVGKDTYNYKYAPYGAYGEEALLRQPAHAYHAGGAQVHSTPVIMPKSPFDPLPRFSDMNRRESYRRQQIEVQQDVHVEMESVARRESDEGSERL